MDEQAVRAWGQLPFTYNSETEELTLSTIEVHKPDGTVTPTGPSAIQDVAVKPFPQLPIFMDLHQKIATVSALRPGDVLVVAAVWTTTHPMIAGQFCFDHTFNRQETVQDEQLEIDAPAGQVLILKNRPGAPAEASGGSGVLAGGRRVYRWKTSNATPEKQDDPALADNEDAPPPDVRITTFKNWDEVARWYRGLLPSATDPRIAAKAAELTKGLSDPAAKIDAIYAYVATQVRYVSLSFGMGRFAPHPPADVLANQYGDCKDKETLLAALLFSVGVASAPVLVNTERSVDDDFPSPAEFNHLIAVVPRGREPEWLWLDSTTEVAPPGLLSLHVRHRKALLVGDGEMSSRVVTTPADPPFALESRVELEGKVDEIGVLKTRVTLTLRGDAELVTRLALRSLPRESWKDFAEGLVSAAGLSGDVSDVDASDLADTRRPLQLTLTLRVGKYLDWAAAATDAPVLSPTIRMSGWTDGDRKGHTRIRLGSPSLIAVHGTIEFPPGRTLQAPVAVTATNAGLEYRSTYGVDGRRFTFNREMRNTVREIPASAFGAYSAFITAVNADAGQRVKITGAATAAPPVPADATAWDVYQAGLSAYNIKKYDIAITLWKRTTELDPKLGDAWVALGLAYDEVGKYDEAASAIQKQIDLDPFNKRAYRDLGYALAKAKKLEPAAKAYAKHVELNPVDGDVLKTLGEIYSDLERYPDAAATLEKASSLVAADGWMLALLGQAYLKIHDADRARHAFDRALDAEQSPRVWTKIAWNLSEAGVDLDRAADLATRTVMRVSEETADLTIGSVKPDHLDLVERLAWAWDTIGWVNFQKGKLADAERYLRASWALASFPVTATHVTKVFEKRYRGQAAGTAKPIASHTALTLPGRAPAGRAGFVALIGNDQRVLDVRFAGGSDALQSFEPALRKLTYQEKFPDDTRMRLPLTIQVHCAAAGECVAVFAFHREAQFPQAQEKQ